MEVKSSDDWLKTPCIKDIYEGATVDIINGEGVLQGRGTLLKRCPSRWKEDNLPYVKHERDSSGHKKRGSYGYIWSYEKWQVQWISHHYLRSGQITCSEVHFFVHTRLNQDSLFDIHSPKKNKYNQYIFLEEMGVLVSRRGEYTPSCVRAIHKIHKVYGGELVVYAKDHVRTRQKFVDSGIKPRILSFLNPEVTYEQGIAEFVEKVDTNEFVIFVGVSKIEHPRVINIDYSSGLWLKKDLKKQKYA